MFLRIRLADFEARGLIKKADIEVTQASPVLIVRNEGKESRFVVGLRSLNEYLEIQCRASIAVKESKSFLNEGRAMNARDYLVVLVPPNDCYAYSLPSYEPRTH